jgi:phosphohistidine phosphatase SixA
MTRAALPAISIVLLLAPGITRAQEAIYIVRHAERLDQSANSALSDDGTRRAFRLRDLLREAGVTHIFTSELRRTIDTGKPLADALHVAPQALPGAEVAALASRLTSLGAHDRALVVGHSNTVPQLLRALKIDTAVTINDGDYDNLFIVVPVKDSAPSLLRLKF